VRYGYPGFEHCPPLWYDRRRDAHDVQARSDGHVVSPYLEMPWGRSDRGQACDGLPLYDLTTFNSWYFDRLREFAAHCDRKGCLLFFNFYNQHNLLETQAHYADYPWRPANCIQPTDLPDKVPVANVFYDVAHPVRRELHRLYIRHCLARLGGYRNVVFLAGSEYTGPAAFLQFWVETILEWEQEAGKKVHIGLGAPKDVLDTLLRDPAVSPHIGTVDIRYWHYKPDGNLYAPPGGHEVPGRYVGGSSEMTPAQIYAQVKEYRMRYPEKAIIHDISGNQQQTLAFLMAGGSMLIRPLDDVGEYPSRYEMPVGCQHILTAYEIIRSHFAADLARMRPLDIVSQKEGAWCLGEPGSAYLIYMVSGSGGRFQLDLSQATGKFTSRWVGMRLGKVFDAFGGTIQGGQIHHLAGPDWRQWMLWLKKEG
jgi:hypothetical protein